MTTLTMTFINAAIILLLITILEFRANQPHPALRYQPE